MSGEQILKRFDFKKGAHDYSYYYDDVKELINMLVDQAEAPEINFDVMDVFTLVRNLALKSKVVEA